MKLIKYRNAMTAVGLCIHNVYPLFALVLCFSGVMFSNNIAEAKGLAVFDAAVIAQPPVTPRAFDVIGFLEAATLDASNAAGTCSKAASDTRLAGGTAKINGVTITIPCNTIVQMPASSMTWADIFALNPGSISGLAPQTGLALTDAQTVPQNLRAPFNGVLPSYEFHIQGNIVQGKYIAGLVFISQEFGNVGQGVIEKIDYDLGELNIKNGTTGELVRVRINDPIGQYGKPHAASAAILPDAVVETDYDPRLAADLDNPTIRAVTGFPMCIPRSNPFLVGQGDDILCPESNRPRSPNCTSLPAILPNGAAGFPPFALPPTGVYCSQFMMDAPNTLSATCSGATCKTDPTRQAPFEIGDYVSYSGTLKTAVDLLSNNKYSYISAHTIVANLGIYTYPRTPPVYVALETTLVGTNALPIANLPQETTSAVKIEGFSTDPTNLVDIFMVDVDNKSGVVSDRHIGTENPGLPPVIGRFRFQPIAGSYGPFTRDIRIVSKTACFTATKTCAQALPLVANGIQAGQYRAPNFDFIFPEAVRTGDPMVPYNFQDLYFLYCGSGPVAVPDYNSPLTSKPIAEALDPAPWAAPMPNPIFTCSTTSSTGGTGGTVTPANPIVNVGAAQSVTTGANVTLSATATDPAGTTLKSFVWKQVSGTTVVLTPGGTPAAPTLKFTAPTVPGVLTFSLSVTNATGQTGTAQVTVAVNPDVVTIVSAVYDNSKSKGVLTVVATSSLAATTSGLQLSVQANNSTYYMASSPQAMSIVANTASSTVCPAASNPCWRYNVTGVIKNNFSTSFMPPANITVTSTRGGTASVGSSSIVLR